jgi:hypothetical protein
MSVDFFLTHFCAHVCTSYFLFDQFYAFLRKSKVSNFYTVFVSLVVAVSVGFLYKIAELYLGGYSNNLWQSIAYNMVGVLLSLNKNVLEQ